MLDSKLYYIRMKGNKMEERIEKLLEIISQSISKLKEKDNDLIKRNVHERTISFRLGYYMQNLLYEYGFNQNVVLDSEYNKNGSDTKKVYYSCRHNLNGCNSKECYIKKNKNKYNINQKSKTLYEYCKNTKEIKYMIPDLIIHERMSKGNKHSKNNNLVAIEIKKGSNKKIKEDYAKLTYLTCDKGEYQFLLGISICLTQKTEIVRVFKEGQIIGKSLNIEDE